MGTILWVSVQECCIFTIGTEKIVTSKLKLYNYDKERLIWPPDMAHLSHGDKRNNREGTADERSTPPLEEVGEDVDEKRPHDGSGSGHGGQHPPEVGLADLAAVGVERGLGKAGA